MQDREAIRTRLRAKRTLLQRMSEDPAELCGTVPRG
jgi:hypothetical protein